MLCYIEKLGIVCLAADTAKPNELQESFLNLTATNLELAIPLDVNFESLLEQTLTQVKKKNNQLTNCKPSC